MDIEGYICRYNEVDLANDVCRQNSFKGIAGSQLTINPVTKRVTIPILLNHEPDNVLGYCSTIISKAKGVYITGTITHSPACKQSRGLLCRILYNFSGGFSIGYKTQESHTVNNIRNITRFELWEVSLTAVPMQKGTAVKLS